jgi:hypothetical protein
VAVVPRVAARMGSTALSREATTKALVARITVATTATATMAALEEYAAVGALSVKSPATGGMRWLTTVSGMNKISALTFLHRPLPLSSTQTFILVLLTT